MMSRGLLPWFAIMMLLVGLSHGDFNKDKQQCADTLVGLTTCLPYVSGEAKAPTKDCCAKLKPVVDTNRVCLCILVKDRDEPNLGVKINATLALGLPETCHTPTNITECPKLMNLSPNSPEAKIFEDYGKNANKSNIATVTPSGNGSSGSITSNVGRGKNWLGIEKLLRTLYIIIMALLQIV